ncbi:MAG: cupin domain-containing protein [Burkholderiaceae bacterium]
MNTQEFEAGLRAEQYGEIVTVEKPAGYSMGEHQHAFDACALITQGAITITVEGVERTYGMGDIFRLKAGTPHLENAVPHGVTYLVGRRQVLATAST